MVQAKDIFENKIQFKCVYCNEWALLDKPHYCIESQLAAVDPDYSPISMDFLWEAKDPVI